MREMHWHPNADEWQYWIKGTGQMTVFDTGPRAVTLNFNAGDIGYVKRNNGTISRISAIRTCSFSLCSGAPIMVDVSLNDWLTHTPPLLVAQHFNIDKATIAKFPNGRPLIVPE
jgi:oxalate decarboxylase